MKKILIISTSLRKDSNSDSMAAAFAKGAVGVGHSVEHITLIDQRIQFCKGCLSCQNTHACPIADSMPAILKQMKDCDVLVFATPIYFYELSGQLKTFLDRTNPLYDTNYQFRDIYLLASAAEENKTAVDGAVHALQGWISCFPKTQLKGVVYGVGLQNTQDILHHSAILQDAMDMGRSC